MVNKIHYRWDFIGLSTDTKPTPEESPKVVNGSTFYESDTSKLFVFYKDTWYERKPLGGGGGGGGTEYTAGDGIDITNDVISVDTDTIQPKLTAGANISIVDDTISATDTTYSHFTGTDGTSAGAAGLVPAPVATDAGKFLNANGSWEEVQAGATYTAGDGINISAQDVISATNTGKAKVLTADDYNYPANNPTSVALWLLGPGVYVPADMSVSLRVSASEGLFSGFAVVGGAPNGGQISILVATNGPVLRLYQTRVSDGYQVTAVNVRTPVNDNLTSASVTSALSANQGRVLKNLIDSIAIRGAGAPTTSTVGEVGQLYEDGTNGALYQLKSIDITTTPNTYNWEQVGGSSVNVVQTTGTSTTDVMSQNAVTSMVFNSATDTASVVIGREGASATGTRNVVIGNDSSNTGANGVAIGYYARVSHNYSVALGAGSKTTANGQLSLEKSATFYGHNNTVYTLLSGLYDPQSDHDAATKGYVDGLIAALEARIAALEGN